MEKIEPKHLPALLFVGITILLIIWEVIKLAALAFKDSPKSKKTK